MLLPGYRVLGPLCALVLRQAQDERLLPIGTNLGVLHLFWTLVSGQPLGSRGAISPGLQALGQGTWTSRRLLKTWARVVQAAGFWQPHVYGGYHPVAVDLTAFWRLQLQNCPTWPELDFGQAGQEDG